ncbi:MAG: hypothetical protein ACI4ES_12345 [Roseburia sp.]
MGLFSKKEVTSEYFNLLQDIGKLTAGNMTKIELFDDHLELSNMVQKTPITLKYSQITDVKYTDEIETIEKSKSVIGRAIVGKVLFGDVGAQVGAISGTGTKQKKEHHFLFAISYTTSLGEESALLFEDTRLHNGVKLYNNLLEKCNLTSGNPNNDITEL